MLKNYMEFILEKKDTKAERIAIQEKIMKLFKERPEIKSKSDNWPDSKNVYKLGDIKEFVGGDNIKTDGAFHDLMKDDDKIKSISVKIKYYNQSYPYYYHTDHTSEDEAKEAKERMESSQKEPKKSKPKVIAKTRKTKGDVPKKPRASKK